MERRKERISWYLSSLGSITRALIQSLTLIDFVVVRGYHVAQSQKASKKVLARWNPYSLLRSLALRVNSDRHIRRIYMRRA